MDCFYFKKNEQKDYSILLKCTPTTKINTDKNISEHLGIR